MKLCGIWATVLAVALIDKGLADDVSSGQRNRWAIIATNSSALPLSELLTADLSSQTNLELVERTEIDRVLAELQLTASGLAGRSEGLRFGRLLGAEALLLLGESTELPERSQGHTATKLIRARLVDTRSSVRLLDVTLPSGTIDQEVDGLVTELTNASRSLAIDSDALQYLSVLPVTSGEPGNFLRPYCNALTALLASELGKHSNVVVLEREDLRHLIDEQNLSGIPMDVLGATATLEISVRRDQSTRSTTGKVDYVSICKISAPSTGKQYSFEVRCGSNDVGEMRAEIAREVTQRRGLSKPKTPQSNAELEANSLDARGRWLASSYQYERWTVNAEAALAISPTRERLETAVRAYTALHNAYLRPLQTQSALLADIRRSQLVLRLIALDPKSQLPSVDPPMISKSYARRFIARTADEMKILAEATSLRRKIIGELLENHGKIGEVGAEKVAGALLILSRIRAQQFELEFSFAPDSDESLKRSTRAILDLFAALQSAGIAKKVTDPRYNEFVRMMLSLFERVDRASLQERGMNAWTVNDFQAWLQTFRNLDPRFVEAAALVSQTKKPGLGRNPG